jgi:hypothetical protein
VERAERVAPADAAARWFAMPPSQRRR